MHEDPIRSIGGLYNRIHSVCNELSMDFNPWNKQQETYLSSGSPNLIPRITPKGKEIDVKQEFCC